jgi:hypothetical protein
MAEAYFNVDEYLWFDETIQGNVNVAGLVYDDLFEETLGLGPEELLVVYSEMISESLGIAEAFTPYHQAFVGEILTFVEWFGTPLRVRQSLINLIMTWTPSPARIANVHLDILHGVDIYWEEVSSELQCNSTYANAVPYYWEWLYDTLDIDMTEPQPQPPVVVALQFLNNDILNMRHEVTQEYLFNSQCFDVLFMWDMYTWGWYHLIESLLNHGDAVQEIIGKVADEHLYMVDAGAPKVKVSHLVDDRFFAFDKGVDEKYFLLVAADTIDFADITAEIFGQVLNDILVLQGVPVAGMIRMPLATDAMYLEDAVVSEKYFLELAEETIDISDGVISFLSYQHTLHDAVKGSDVAVPVGSLGAIATESLVFADLTSYVHGLMIDEALELGDLELTEWLFNVLVESGFDLTDIIG